MFNEAEYQLIWSVYLVAALLGWLVWWQMTRWISWWFVREPLWVMMAVVLFTPVRADPEQAWMAPGSIILALDTLLDTGENQARVLGEMSLVLALALVAWGGFVCVRTGWRMWRQQQAEA
ncbi:hypothetical protein [Halopseudomonas salegens]|uniref:Uncharacterized protein n=1 Tax=Halopseudomonas salegens TaxID=1434072 RepID=A0A1H2ESN9_9GAMM|nr:hypothetical protein [Halopseudomonas salegens]SDT98084.1 hypothetical protein SAMN05216210_1003 [Halopseudomonas salegens]